MRTEALLALHLLKHFEAPPAARRAPDRGRNYLSRHWRGELPLAISYWVNGWLAEVVGLCAIALLSRSGARVEPPYARLLSWIAAWVITGTAAIWYWVGTWRSSDRPNAAGWISSWSGAAKFGVIVGAIACVAAFTAGGWPALHALLAEARR